MLKVIGKLLILSCIVLFTSLKLDAQSYLSLNNSNTNIQSLETDISTEVQSRLLDKSLIYKIGFPIVPGYIEINRDNSIYGFPVEIFMHIADSLGIKYEFVNDAWGVLLEKNKKGELDALLATQRSVEREVFLDFLDESVYDSWGELLVRKRTNIENLYDFTGKKIGIVENDNNGIAFQHFVNDFKLDYIPVFYNSHSAGLEGLRNKDVMALVSPPMNLVHYGIRDVKSSGIIYNPNSSSISFPKGKNNAFRYAVNKELRKLKEDKFSVYYSLRNEYGLDKVKRDPSVPLWLILVSSIGLSLLLIVLFFVFVLREQVNRKTEQLKRRQEKLEERAVYLSKTMEVGNMGTWIYYIKQNKVYLSDQIYNLIGYEKGSIKSPKELIKLYSPIGFARLGITFKKALKNKENFDIVLEHSMQSKKVSYSRQIGVLVFDEFGKPDRVLGISQNISDQIRYERDLIYAKQKAVESEQLKSAFLANMSHEIRTPLNAIVGFTELLVEYEQTQEDKDRFKRIILDQNQLLLNLINDVVDFAKMESGSMELVIEDKVIVADIVGNCFSMVKHQCPEHLKFNLEIDSSMWGVFVNVDKKRFKQIIINLVINAFKYTEKGHVELGCRTSAVTNKVEVYVRDTGIGIAKDKQELIFNRFAQINPTSQGTGLGLAISRSLAELMQAAITVESEPGKGSEFIFSIARA